ncbi:MAG: hypothetical protein JWM97_930 [Phycisphaerales bacterium]|nr:hypothetical protein [Phycisphaerales bacterium]
MIPTESAIHRVRRDITFGMLLKFAFLLAVVGSVLFAPQSAKLAVLIAVGIAWLFLSFTSARTSRMAVGSPSLIAAGEFEEAEKQIDQAMRGFSLFRTAKLQALHHLAVLRHAQRRWEESAALSRALLSQRLRAVDGLSRPARLILVDALLEMNDLRGANESIQDLYRHRLTLSEVLTLVLVQLDYSARVGEWEQMFAGATAKVQLAELMPAPRAARAQALLALAALRLGRADWAAWLRQRVELLADVNTLTTERPVLWELWAAARADQARAD